MAAPEALAAATQTAAELLGLQDELGSIEAGKRADLVLVSGDPCSSPLSASMSKRSGRTAWRCREWLASPSAA